MTSYEEHMDRLASLRQQFPDWWFSWRMDPPQWSAQRSGLDYTKVPAAISGVSGNDPDEIAQLLGRVPLIERVEPT